MQKIQSAPSTPIQGVSSTPVILLPTPTAAIHLENRPALGQQPAPPGYDPRHARLDFEFPNNLEYSNASSGTAAIPVNLFADGYLIGATRFGLPWMLRCARSPDGLRLAFNTFTDGASLPDDALRWLDLRDPSILYQPLPGWHAIDFAFSPDSQKLAVFATSTTVDQAGVYLIMLATGDYKKVLSLADARSLLWSPDGEFLALIGVEQPADAEQLLVLHLRSDQISFRADPLPSGAPLPADWPIANWGLAFPVAAGDLHTCSNPPPE